MKELRLVGSYEPVYREIKAFVRERLFAGATVDLDDPQVLRNLSDGVAAKRVFDTFKAAINRLLVEHAGSSVEIDGFIRLRDVRPFRTEPRDWLAARRSIFNRIVGEPNAGGFELRFARFLYCRHEDDLRSARAAASPRKGRCGVARRFAARPRLRGLDRQACGG